MSAENHAMKLAANRLAKPALLTVSVVAAIGVVGFASGPVFVRSLAEDKLGELLGRKVTIGELTINPYTLSATLGKVAITEPDGTTPFIAFERLYANLSSTSLAGGVRIQQLDLEQPQVHLVRQGDNHYNISDLIEKFSKPSDEPTRFALANIKISGGRMEFDDKPMGKIHTVDKLQLGVPFVSNFPADLDVEVQPEFTATIDGTTLVLGGEAKPFKNSRDTNLSLRLEGIDLPRWLPYSPVPLPVTVKSALLDTDLAIRFQTGGKQPELSVSGNAALKNFNIQDKQGRPLLQGERLTVDVASIKPFAREANIREAALIAPKVNVERDRTGALNWQTAFTTPATTPATPAPAAPTAASPWKWSLAAARVRAGELSWNDDLPRGGYQTKVQDLVLDIGRTSQNSALPLRLSLKTVRDETFSLEGRLTPAPFAAEGKFELGTVDVAALTPYFADLLKLKLASAKAGASGDFTVKQQNQTLSKGRVTLDNVRFTDSGKDALALKSLLADAISLDATSQRVNIGKLTLDGPSAKLINDRQGLNAGRWFAADHKIGKPAVRPARKTATDKGWQVALDELAVSNGAVKLRDTTQRRPVAMDLADIRLNSSKLASDHRGEMPLDLAMTVNKRGRLAANGRIDPFALSGNLDLRADRLDLAPLTVMATQAERVNIRRAELDTRGKLAFAKRGEQVNASYRGNVAVNNVRVTDELNAGTELLRWRTLKLDGLDVHTAPANKVGVRNIALDSFFARVVLNQNGKLNLREIQDSWGGNPTASPLETQAAGAAPAKTMDMPGGGTETTAKLPAKPVPSAPLPDIRIDRIALSRGDVNWTDNFIRPNYRADLTQLRGTIGRIATRNNQAGDVDITGKVNNDAPLTIAGKVNPFARPVVLDMTAAVKGLDLPPLSPYSGKYAGYAIEKGKLSVDLHYVVDAGKLTAQNKLFLDQLTFGDKVDSPSATKLPVLLAVSLLKNRKGEIDVNLPVSGSLDDPQFSVGGLVVRVIVNLLEKAITSPFTLLANAFGGDAEKLSQLDFIPGTFTLDPANRKKLDNLASILNDKPGLKLEIHGEADPTGDLAGAQRVRFEEEVAKRWQNQGGDPDQKPDAKSYAAIVKDIYSDGKFKKPRNVIGLAKSLPVDEMEKLIVANTKVSDKDVNQLASRRALMVKNYLTEQAKLSGERLFIVGSKEAGKSRVEFKLK